MSEAFNRDFSAPNGNVHQPARIRSLRLRQKRASRIMATRIPSPGLFPILGAIAGFIFIIILTALPGRSVDANVPTVREEWLHASAAPAETIPPQSMRTRLQAGDSSSAALERLGFDANAIYQMIQSSRPVYSLADVRAGHDFERINRQSGIDVYYQIDGLTRLHLHQPAEQKEWQADIAKRAISARQHVAAATIEDSLFSAAAAAGLDDRTTMNLVDIFSWDIDFARDIRKGDSFRVIYEERFDDSGKALGSTILAAEFINQGESFKAIRYEQADGQVSYYTPEGKSMRKSYLKAPVKFSRISSRFQAHRMHPVLGYTRAHHGVDYAAPSGTPIHAIGDGRIEFAGWKGGYGRFVLIRHTNREQSTAYGHMSAFAKGIRRGVHVHQGQVIGYVGMSGLATGPHLHFEFRLRGRPINPLTIKRTPANPVAASELARFQQLSSPLLSRLHELRFDPAWG
ncbi:MAG TPA: peptidoglycan DD-metalloendopeptidase family protein [Mariprofundaceae bacterium]|nr:peptidoglycan DD-metalloendopeptidase family protein [Mariprofundaceae bacterium]